MEQIFPNKCQDGLYLPIKVNFADFSLNVDLFKQL